MKKTISKTSDLSSLPIFGSLFKSKEIDRNNTKLVLLVTPEVTMPLQPGEAEPIPAMPRDFLTPNGTAGPVSEQVEGNTKIQVTKTRTAI